MSVPYVEYPEATGSGPFAVPFPYQAQDHVQAIRMDTDEEVLLNWVSSSTVTTSLTFSGAEGLAIRRVTPVDLANITFQPGAFSARDLNNETLQLLYAIQEAQVTDGLNADAATAAGLAATAQCLAIYNDMLSIQASGDDAAAIAARVPKNTDGSDFLYPLSILATLGLAGHDRFRTFESFGATADALANGTGTDDTAPIQEALNWALSEGGAIMMTAKNFLCANVVSYAYACIVGSGRHTSNFIAKPGTAGKWFTDGGNAAKSMLSGIGWYANNELAITSILNLGNNGIQFGTEGILRDLFLRDAINGDGLNVNSNVGFFRDISVWGCRRPITIRGNANMCSGLVSHGAGEGSTGAITGGPAFVRGMELSGCLVDGLEIEAPVSGAVPLKINGDTRISKWVVSLATGTTFDHLVQVDTSVYNEWDAPSPLLFAGSPPASVTGGIYLVGGTYAAGEYVSGGTYQGGTSVSAASGVSLVSAMVAQRLIDTKTSDLRLDDRRLQSFRIRLIMSGGVLLHRVGQHGDVNGAAELVSKIVGAISDPPNTTPTAGAAFVGGLSVLADNQTLVLNTSAVQTSARQLLLARIVATNTGASSADLTAAPRLIDGVTQGRHGIRFFKPDGTIVTLTSMANGDYINLVVEGYTD